MTKKSSFSDINCSTNTMIQYTANLCSWKMFTEWKWSESNDLNKKAYKTISCLLLQSSSILKLYRCTMIVVEALRNPVCSQPLHVPGLGSNTKDLLKQIPVKNRNFVSTIMIQNQMRGGKLIILSYLFDSNYWEGFLLDHILCNDQEISQIFASSLQSHISRPLCTDHLLFPTLLLKTWYSSCQSTCGLFDLTYSHNIFIRSWRYFILSFYSSTRGVANILRIVRLIDVSVLINKICTPKFTVRNPGISTIRTMGVKWDLEMNNLPCKLYLIEK